jgi:hypothetical protein
MLKVGVVKYDCKDYSLHRGEPSVECPDCHADIPLTERDLRVK